MKRFLHFTLLLIGLLYSTTNSLADFGADSKKLSESYDLAESIVKRALETSAPEIQALGLLETAKKIDANLRAFQRRTRLDLNAEQLFTCKSADAITHGADSPYAIKLTSMFVCPATLSTSGDYLAQTLIHEGAHMLGIENECTATKIQITLSVLAGHDPIMSGYVKLANATDFGCTKGAFGGGWSDWFLTKAGIKKSFDYDAWSFRSRMLWGVPALWTYGGQPADKLSESDRADLGEMMNAKSAITGMTPLMVAAKYGRTEWVNFAKDVLIGVDYSLRSNENLTAADYARNSGFSELLPALDIISNSW